MRQHMIKTYLLYSISIISVLGHNNTPHRHMEQCQHSKCIIPLILRDRVCPPQLIDARQHVLDECQGQSPLGHANQLEVGLN